MPTVSHRPGPVPPARAFWTLLISLFFLVTLSAGAFGADTGWKPAPAPLMTRFAKQVSPARVLPEYPRPQMVRKEWQNLNGRWEYALTDPAAITPPTVMTGKILVPFPYESALSGVGKLSIPDRRLWYRRTFAVPASWKGKNILLHFGAVNYDASISVNGMRVGSHRGGYTGFDCDITRALKPGVNTLIVSVTNPLDDRKQVLGNQRARPGEGFYTASTGIWQTVWLEPVPTAYIRHLKAIPDIDSGKLRVVVETGGTASENITVEAVAKDGGTVVAKATGKVGATLEVLIPDAKLWSPASPFLYDLELSLRQNGTIVDTVRSYFGMRKVSLTSDYLGHTRIALNNKSLFQVGALDQGYWPDGLYTAPTDEAIQNDIDLAKKLGFNLLRKHAKIESARWYYWADRKGILVWQDMPPLFGNPEDSIDPATRGQFERELREMLNDLAPFPSIIAWVLFNAGWGEHDTAKIASLAKTYDPSRLIDSVSGGNDRGSGDIVDAHIYPGYPVPALDRKRAAVISDFGALVWPVRGHRWSVNTPRNVTQYRNAWQLTRFYQESMRSMIRDATDQNSAVVYRQLVDGERETNGLVTLDREVIKPDVRVAVAAIHGNVLPIPASLYPPDVLPTAEVAPVYWNYTTDKPRQNWMMPGYIPRLWQAGPAPFGSYVGSPRTPWSSSDIWLRREFTLPEKIPAKLAFSLLHDEDTEIYLNGVLAASVRGYNTWYDSVAMNAAGRAALKPGKNIIAVHVHQTSGGQVIDVGIIEATAIDLR